MSKPRLIVILGPTASGKSSLAIQLARKFNGEIISADSRQLYKGMDIGTGKVTTQERKQVPHHLLDVTSPKSQFTVARFKPLAQNAIKSIVKKNKLPFLVGGTPFYIYAVIDDLSIPEVKPNLKLRKQLDKKSVDQLYSLLKKLDPRRAAEIDRHNPRRLIRAIEIIKSTRHAIPALSSPSSPYDLLILGIKKSPDELAKLIAKRLDSRLKQGMISEVRKLIKSGVSKKRLHEMGLEYRFIALHLQGKLSFAEMRDQLLRAIIKFSKRQMTWFKTDKRTHWIKNNKQAEKLILNFLKQ